MQEQRQAKANARLYFPRLVKYKVGRGGLTYPSSQLTRHGTQPAAVESQPMAALVAPSSQECAHGLLNHPLFPLLCGLRSLLLAY